MSLDNTFRTKTMARIFVEQGQLEKAVDIYESLLAENFDQPDVKAELAAVKRKLKQGRQNGILNLEPLYREWIELELNSERF